MAATWDGDNFVRVWEVKTGNLVHQWKGWIAYFTPDGKQALTVTGGNNPPATFHLYDVETGKEVQSFDYKGDVGNFRILPNGKRVVVMEAKTWVIWELATGKELHRIARDTDLSRAVFTSDGNFLVYSPDGKPCKVLNLETGKEVKAFENILDNKGMYRFLPGDRELMCFHDTTIQIFEVASGKLVREVDVGAGANWQGESLTPDGKRVLTFHPDGTYRLWDIAAKKVIQEYKMTDGRNPRPAFVSPDGRYATASTDGGSVYLWRLPDPPAK
jgi:hypothetical protein